VKSDITFTKVRSYYNPAVIFSIGDEEARLTAKDARQFAHNLLKCVDELEGTSQCGARFVKGMEISTCQLRFWANPRFRL
jgi:hypothetical protein